MEQGVSIFFEFDTLRNLDIKLESSTENVCRIILNVD